MGGGWIHLQLQLLPDDPQVSYSDIYCSTGALSTLAQSTPAYTATTEIHSSPNLTITKKISKFLLKTRAETERFLSEFRFGPPFVPVCDGVLLHGPLLC